MLSIIIPVYNSEKYLKECIDSVVKQLDFIDYELLCINDGSTDGSEDILQSYSNNSHITIIHQENAGAGAARNNGIAHAKGDYIMFLDSDDLMADGQDIAQAYNYAIENNIDILLCGHNVIEENGSLICTVIPNFRILSNGYNNEKEIINKRKSYHPSEAGLGLFQLSYNGPCAKLYRRAFIIEHRLQFLTLKRSEDFPFVELSLAAAERIATLDKILFYRRQNVNASLENSKDETPLIFHEAETQLHTELKNRGLDTFIPAANLQAVIRLQYNLASMRSFKGFETLYEKLQDYYNEYHIAVPVTSPAYEAYSYASTIIEKAISYGNAGDFLMAQIHQLNQDIYSKDKTIEYFKEQISITINRPIFRIYNSILNLFHRK